MNRTLFVCNDGVFLDDKNGTLDYENLVCIRKNLCGAREEHVRPAIRHYLGTIGVQVKDF